MHGDRFQARFFIYVSRWLRAKLWKHLWSHHTEQYRKAWFASFPPELWPAEEEETEDGRIFLRLKGWDQDSGLRTSLEEETNLNR
jgi:hypothetical protein